MAALMFVPKPRHIDAFTELYRVLSYAILLKSQSRVNQRQMLTES